MSTSQLKTLKVRRGQIKAICTRAQATLASNAIHTMSASQLHECKAKIEASWSQFDNVQTEIELLEDSPELKDTHEESRIEYEEAYYHIISRFQDLILEIEAVSAESAQTNHPLNNQIQAHTNNVRLSKIDLPSFSGSFEEWYSFHDTFQSLIHNNQSISGVQRFHYLKSALNGEAAEIIRSLEISSENYEEAWQMLKNRYDDKRLIIQKHIKALFELPTISKENHTKLRQLVDGSLKHLRALKTIGRPIDSWDDVLIHLVTGKLDGATNKEWENSLTGDDIPTWHKLTNFLEHRCHVLEAIDRKVQVQPASSSLSKVNQTKATSHVATYKASCQICKGNHFIFSCDQFLKFSPEARFKCVKENKLCLNCLRFSSHTAKTCKSSSCKTCGKRHNTLLHMDQTNRNTTETVTSPQTREQVAASPSTIVSHTSNCFSSTQVLLSTALVNATDCQGVRQTCRALLDSGSQSNFITEDLVRRLGLTTRSINTPVVGINQSWTHAQEMVKVTVSSRHHNFNIIFDCLVLKQISDRLPNFPLDIKNFKIPQNLRLADPTFHQSTDIEILFGAEVFWDILCISQIKESPDHPLLQKTLFGWIFGGKCTYIPNQLKAQQCNLSTNSSTVSLDNAISKFWQIEQIIDQPTFTTEERECEKHFRKTHSRNDQGRFIVEMPLKQDALQSLGSSYNIALKRFHSLERKLNKNPDLRDQYTQFLEEYQALGHMRLINPNVQNANFTYYLPHHAV